MSTSAAEVTVAIVALAGFILVLISGFNASIYAITNVQNAFSTFFLYLVSPWKLLIFLFTSLVNLLTPLWKALSTRELYEHILRGMEILTWLVVGSIFLIAKRPEVLDNLSHILGLVTPQEGHWAGGFSSLPVPRMLRQLYESPPEIVPAPADNETQTAATTSPTTPPATTRNTVRGPRPRNDVDDQPFMGRNLPAIPGGSNEGEGEDQARIQLQHLGDALAPLENRGWVPTRHSPEPPEYEDDEPLPPFRSIAGTIRSNIGRGIWI